jgi:hypothetical protein
MRSILSAPPYLSRSETNIEMPATAIPPSQPGLRYSAVDAKGPPRAHTTMPKWGSGDVRRMSALALLAHGQRQGQRVQECDPFHSFHSNFNRELTGNSETPREFGSLRNIICHDLP